MLLLALLAQVASASPPPSTPTPIPILVSKPTATRPAAAGPRTLADVARERKGKKKPAGNFTVAGTAAEGATADAPEAASETPAEGGPPRPVVRIQSVRRGQLLDATGAISVDGEIRNNGPGTACHVAIAITVLSEDGKVLGSRTLAARSERIPQGESAAFQGAVTVPSDTQVELTGDGSTTIQNAGIGKRRLGRAEAKVVGMRSCD